MIWKLIRRNVAGKPFRFLLTCSAVTAGVMFVVGIFVFTDGLRQTFSELAGDIEGNVDLAVRTEVEFGGDFNRPVIDVAVADTIAEVPGVEAVQPRIIGQVTVVDGQGEPQEGNGPNIGFNWEAETPNPRLFLQEGRAPDAPFEFAFEQTAFEDGDFVIGDTYTIEAPGGVYDDVILKIIVNMIASSSSSSSSSSVQMKHLLVLFTKILKADDDSKKNANLDINSNVIANVEIYFNSSVAVNIDIGTSTGTTSKNTGSVKRKIVEIEFFFK